MRLAACCALFVALANAITYYVARHYLDGTFSQAMTLMRLVNSAIMLAAVLVFAWTVWKSEQP